MPYVPGWLPSGSTGGINGYSTKDASRTIHYKTGVDETLNYTTTEWAGGESKTQTRNGSIINLGGGTFIAPTTYERGVKRIERGDPPSGRTANNFSTYGTTWSDWRSLTANASSGLFPGVGNGQLTSVPSNTNQHNRAVTEALLKLQEGKVSVGTALAESRKAYNGLVNDWVRLGSALRSVKRGNFRLAAKHLGVRDPAGIGSNYLNYVYGWKPLCLDVYNSLEALKDALNRPQVLYADRTVYESRSGHHGTSGNWENVQWSAEYYNTCKLVAEVKSSVLSGAQSLDLANPLSLGWELVPFSFVVDWGFPVGNVVSALTATAGLDFVAGYTSQSFYFKSSGELPPPTSQPRERVNGKATGEFNHFRREKLTGFPRPLWYAKSPFSVAHGRSALALWLSLRW